MPMAKMRGDAGIYGSMAKWYDKSYRKSRLAEMLQIADTITGCAGDGAAILEVAPGPGYLSIELARRGYAVTGVELSEDFVDIERRNAAEAGVTVDFRQGNASALPVPDEGFDFIVCSAAFKNFKEPVKALSEMYRVLKPGGTALIIDMNHDATAADIDAEVIGMKGFDKWFTRLSFKTFLSKSAYTQQEFENFIAATPFGTAEIQKSGIGFSIYCRKSIQK
ncbi:methyltransferase type 11 [Spirochaetia bacterium]|nr:methyltransferase type 11 [Spirochaetia bacterium]